MARGLLHRRRLHGEYKFERNSIRLAPGGESGDARPPLQWAAKNIAKSARFHEFRSAGFWKVCWSMTAFGIYAARTGKGVITDKFCD
ncbi:MAG: hypothetical protein ACREC0_13210 [Methylocella sp.]